LADRTAAEMVWPLLALRIRTMRLELRLPTCADIVRLAPASYHSAYGVRNGAAFTATELLAREQARSIAEWSVEDWSLTFGAFLNSGEPVGLQTIAAARFPATRTFETPSWVNPARRRKGLATEMRIGVLGLMFDYLGAAAAVASPLAQNFASIGVSERLGYELDQSVPKRSADEDTVRMILTRERWMHRTRPVIEVRGLDVCLALFGLGRTTSVLDEPR
jgi:RimJ/RimL family protein N-acetyltransferase